jgi:phage shock protein A
MGIFSRLTEIANANLNALLDKAEDPEKIVRLMIHEMEDALVEVRSHAAKVIAERKERERAILSLTQQAIEWEAKAELAVRKGRDDLARAALSERGHVDERKAALEHEVALIGEQVSKLNEDIAGLNAKLTDAKNRQRAIQLKARHAEASLNVRGHTESTRLNDMMDRFEHAERRIDRIEAETEALDLGRGRTLSQEIAALEREDKLDAQLAELKAKLKSQEG